MKGQLLSRRVLDGAKFQKVDFTSCKINGAKLNNVLADGAKFDNAELKKSVANNSNFSGATFIDSNLTGFKADKSKFNNCKFDTKINLPPSRAWKPAPPASVLRSSEINKCEMKNCVFNKTSFQSSKFSYVDFTGSIFSNIPLYHLIPNPPNFQRCTLDSITLIDNPSLFALFTDPELKLLYNLKIENPNSQGLVEKDFIYDGILFNNLHISKTLFRDCATFQRCEFRDLKFNKNEGEKVQFFKAIFRNCAFQHCDFGEFIGHSSSYRNCTFSECNLSKCDLRSCEFEDSIFMNCNLNAVKFIRSRLTGVNFVEGTILTNIDFQECEGMGGMNFQGLNLQGAKMIGISDPGLNACNFRDANLRGVQFDFSQIHGSDFTGADLTGSNVRVAEGSDQTVGIPADQEEGRAVDTHKTFYNIRINMLVDFYAEKGGFTPNLANHLGSDQAADEVRGVAQVTLRRMVLNLDASETDKRELTSSLDSCFTQRLNTYNFKQIVAGTDPQINFTKLIYCVIKYLEKQPKEFKDIYVQSLIMDSTQAYGPGGMSCAAGIVERFVTVMEQAAAVVKDTVPAKAEEYTELINIITNDPKSLIKNYQQEWFEFHKEGGPNAFAESAALDTIMNSYKDFLEQKFDYANLRGSNKEKIRRVIMEDPTAGVNITREYIENSILFFGGRVKDNRHLNYFKMLKERFYIKERFRKSTTRKNRVKKHSAKKHRKRLTRAKKHRKHRK